MKTTTELPSSEGYSVPFYEAEEDTPQMSSLTAGTVVLAVLGALQLSILLLIVVKFKKRDKSFRQAFYFFFVAVTLVDGVLVICRRYVEYYDIIHYEFLPDYRLKLALSLIVFVGANLQAFLHCAMAVNRLTAFYFSQKHDTMWSGCAVFTTLVGCVLAAAVLGSTAFVYYLITDECEGCEEYVYLVDVLHRSEAGSRILLAANVIFCCITSFIMVICVFVKLRSLSKAGTFQQSSSLRRDVGLFAHSLFMLLAQLLLGFHYVLLSIDYVSGVLEARGIKGFRIYIIDVLGAGPDCYPPSTTNCGWAYALFEGYLTPAVTEYAFSSSGGLFLLLVSSHVRSAYFQFYFKRLRRTATSVILVTQAKLMTTASLSINA